MHGKNAAVVLFPKDIMMFLLRTSFPEFDCEYQSSDQHRHRHEQQKRFIAFRLSRLIEGESRRVGTADIGRSLPARIVRRLPVEVAGGLSVEIAGGLSVEIAGGLSVEIAGRLPVQSASQNQIG